MKSSRRTIHCSLCLAALWLSLGCLGPIPLADDNLTVSGKTAIALKSDLAAGKRYEGAAMVKYKGKYLVAGSGVEGWNPTDTTYAVADATRVGNSP